MYPNWVTAGIAQLIRQFCDPGGNAAWIGVASLDGLGGMPANGLWRRGGRYELMAGVALSDGFIWRPAAAEAYLSERVSKYGTTDAHRFTRIIRL